jgi:uncharacterized lipoprotein YddW (UPF0748 family)
MKKLLPFVLILLLISTQSFTQEPDRELRAVWLTSVYNIDWPHSTNVSPINQQNRLRDILNRLQETNINAVLFQVRPQADALYQSAYEPWSQWITGTRGQVPTYDPLALVIEEAHKRGIEVHAWLNPYRFEINAGQYAGLPGDYSQTHPELIFTHNNRTYFDPGNPGTTQLIKKIIADMITNYNLDGVVFDDYFYPSGMTLSLDQQTYDTWGTLEFVQQWYPDLTRGNFRRASVNNMIREVNDTIKAIDPHMVFGVSPAGIYSTQASAAANWGTTLPSGISGNDNYNVIFCDPLAWLHDGSVDYISPQLYWVIGGPQDFVTLTEWWGFQASRYDKHHYPSLGSYRLYSQKDMPFPDFDSYPAFLESIISHFVKEGESDKFNWPVTEIENQIIANRNSPHNLAQGLIFYNTNTYINTTKDLAGYLANDLFSEKSIFPYLPWLPPTQPGAPAIAEIGAIGEDSDALAMNIADSPAERFLLYGWEQMPTKNNPDEADFMQVVFGKDFARFYPEENAYFSIAEFLPNRELGNISGTYSFEYLDPVVITSPDDETICDMFAFTWTQVPESTSYRVLIATKQNPSTVVFASPETTQNIFELPSGILAGQQNYVFRVKATSPEGVSWSAPEGFFTGYPLSTILNAPANGAVNVNINTTMQWNTVPGVGFYHVQVATDPSFDEQFLVINQEPVNQNIYSITLEQPNTLHYARVRTADACGYSSWSQVNSFTTGQGTSVEDMRPHVLRVFPNPARDNCKVDYPVAVGERTIQWFSTGGQLLGEEIRKDVTTSDSFDLSHLPAGLYTVQIQTGNHEKFVFRVVKANRSK